jgi:hypothetical protein
MKTVVTYKKLLQLKTFANSVANIQNLGDDVVFVLKLQKLAKKACKPLEDFEEKTEDLRLDNCFKENGRIVRQNGEFQWTAEGEKAFRQAYKALALEEVETHFDYTLSYKDFLAILPERDQKLAADWEDMEEVLSPFFVEK